MENRDFYIDQDGLKLHAKLDFPTGDSKKLPLVILNPGLTGHIDETHIIGVKDACLEAGYACLRVELYGHGKSDGKFENHNLMLWQNELLYVIDYALTLDFVTDIILAGHSQGGLNVILTAALAKDRIKALMPLSAAICIRDAAIEGTFFGTKIDPENLPEKIYLWPDEPERFLYSNYARIAKTLPVEQAIAAFDKPVLLVHGDEDEAVPYFYSVEANKQYKNSKFVTVKGDNHCFDHHLEELKKAVTDFLISIK